MHALTPISVGKMVSISFQMILEFAPQLQCLGLRRLGLLPASSLETQASQPEGQGAESMGVCTRRGCDLKGKGKIQPAGAPHMVSCSEGHMMQAEPPYLEHGACPQSGVSTCSQMTPPTENPESSSPVHPVAGTPPPQGNKFVEHTNSVQKNPSICLHSNVHTHPGTYAVHSAMQYDASSSLSTTGLKITQET